MLLSTDRLPKNPWHLLDLFSHILLVFGFIHGYQDPGVAHHCIADCVEQLQIHIGRSLDVDFEDHLNERECNFVTKLCISSGYVVTHPIALFLYPFEVLRGLFELRLLFLRFLIV